MKSFEERTAITKEKVKVLHMKRKRMGALAACLSVVLMIGVLSAVLFIPLPEDQPDLRMYADSPYYDVICSIYEATYQPPAFQNNFEKWSSGLLSHARSYVKNSTNEMEILAPMAPGDAVVEENDHYVETTDNQVQGVIEGDLFKRSDRYLYYFDKGYLKIYSIAQENSVQVGSCPVWSAREDGVLGMEYATMYLSEDCKTITVFFSGYGSVLQEGIKENYLCMVSLDVSDPTNIQENGRKYMSGYLLSGRKVFGDTFLVVTQYNASYNRIDFSNPETFLPGISDGEETDLVPADNIICPDGAETVRYTVVTMLRESTLDVVDTAAFLSYSQELYVSGQDIFVTRGYSQKGESTLGRYTQKDMTEIFRLGYEQTGLTQKGSILLEGSVKNQYAMDVYEGILRVVSSTTEFTMRDEARDGYVIHRTESTKRNVNLTCVSLENMSIVAQVVGFAPEGETAESVRFDGTTAYVCTAEVVQLTDPVYFFDLSDLNNITWKDTGIIEGYSSSLVDFGNGNLLGIGYGSTGMLKIEVYRQSGDTVISVCTYEANVSFSEEYKAYLIDRENQLVGLATYRSGSEHDYILLQFTGYELVPIIRVPCSGQCNFIRADVIDGWLYLLAPGQFDVKLVYAK